MLQSPFTPDFSLTTAASTASAAIAFGAGAGTTVKVYNSGSVPVFFAMGDSTVAATVPTSTAAKNCAFVPPTSTATFLRNPSTQTHIATIVAATPSTVWIGTGEGGQ